MDEVSAPALIRPAPRNIEPDPDRVSFHSSVLYQRMLASSTNELAHAQAAVDGLVLECAEKDQKLAGLEQQVVDLVNEVNVLREELEAARATLKTIAEPEVPSVEG